MRPTAASLGVKDILTDCLKLSGRWCVLRHGRPPDPPDPPAAQLENAASPSGVFLWVTRRHRIRPPAPFLAETYQCTLRQAALAGVPDLNCGTGSKGAIGRRGSFFNSSFNVTGVAHSPWSDAREDS